MPGSFPPTFPRRYVPPPPLLFFPPSRVGVALLASIITSHFPVLFSIDNDTTTVCPLSTGTLVVPPSPVDADSFGYGEHARSPLFCRQGQGDFPRLYFRRRQGRYPARRVLFPTSRSIVHFWERAFPFSSFSGIFETLPAPVESFFFSLRHPLRDTADALPSFFTLSPLNSRGPSLFPSDEFLTTGSL